jgi:hypothetical protein
MAVGRWGLQHQAPNTPPLSSILARLDPGTCVDCGPCRGHHTSSLYAFSPAHMPLAAASSSASARRFKCLTAARRCWPTARCGSLPLDLNSMRGSCVSPHPTSREMWNGHSGTEARAHGPRPLRVGAQQQWRTAVCARGIRLGPPAVRGHGRGGRGGVADPRGPGGTGHTWAETQTRTAAAPALWLEVRLRRVKG